VKEGESEPCVEQRSRNIVGKETTQIEYLTATRAAPAKSKEGDLKKNSQKGETKSRIQIRECDGMERVRGRRQR